MATEAPRNILNPAIAAVSEALRLIGFNRTLDAFPGDLFQNYFKQ